MATVTTAARRHATSHYANSYSLGHPNGTVETETAASAAVAAAKAKISALRRSGGAGGGGNVAPGSGGSLSRVLILALFAVILIFLLYFFLGPSLLAPYSSSQPSPSSTTTLVRFHPSCPVCSSKERALPPLRLPLSARGAKVRLCTGSPSSPFAAGTFVSAPTAGADGVEFGQRYAQLVVFEAEVLHTRNPNAWYGDESDGEDEKDTAEEGKEGEGGGAGGKEEQPGTGLAAGGDGESAALDGQQKKKEESFSAEDERKRRRREALEDAAATAASSSKTTTSLRFLAFLEDDDSIKKTQWEGWGAAELSDLYWKGALNDLKCLVWPGHDPFIHAVAPAYVLDVRVRKSYTFHIAFECVLPPYPSPLTPSSSAEPGGSGESDGGSSSPSEGEGGAGGRRGKKRAWSKKEARRYFVQHMREFQVQLVAAANGTELRMQPLLLCRTDGERTDRLLRAHTDPTAVAPPFPWPKGEVADATDEGKGSGAPEVKAERGTKSTGWFSSSSSPSSSPSHQSSSPSSPFTVSICLRPFHTRQLFSSDIAFPDLRLLEWIDAHLLVGVDRIYFYDRYGMQKRSLLARYIERGHVVYVPFPPWSEVFYRKGQYAGRARVPYLFPEIYDQVVAYEHCMMLGRRYGDRWQFHIDADEFLSYDPRKGAFLKPLLARLEANHSRSAAAAGTAARAGQQGKHPRLAVILLRRFNFWGIDNSTRQSEVLERLTWRCAQPMWHTEGWAGWHDKLAVNPQIILPHTVTIHMTSAPSEIVATAPKELLRIHHYTSTAVELGHHPCRSWVKPVKDEALAWVPLRVAKCRLLPCARNIPVECWPFCVLPWPQEGRGQVEGGGGEGEGVEGRQAKDGEREMKLGDVERLLHPNGEEGQTTG